MAKKGTSKSAAKPLNFDQKLVLNQWMLSLFEVRTFEELAKDLKDRVLEELDEDKVSRFHLALKARLFPRQELSADLLSQYDQNIVRHTQAIAARRPQPIRWKYFQYLCLLFTEIYLDRFFTDSEKLLRDLNNHVFLFNAGKAKDDQVDPYRAEDLRKLAYWSATGSGKTLLMHVNVLQYKHYLRKAGRTRELNRIILLTPNEGLSQQHLKEFAASGIDADLFDKDAGSLFKGTDIEIIDIHKLRDEMGEKTVAVEAFESKNLVMVDEGHRGSSGIEWKAKRDQLCEQGFSFEYSATFGQAMKTSGNKPLQQEYAKCILFDYSYKYFYGDGYGKDYSILNLEDDRDEDVRQLYLTACLLGFYQQLKVYDDNHREFRPYLLERPLWIFVGGSVNAVRSENKRKVSDVVDVLLFLADFAGKRRESIKRIKRLLSGAPGLRDAHGHEIFANTFVYLIKTRMTEEGMFDDVLKVLFNAPAGGKLHVENLKGTDGEVALRLGDDNDPFGLINVGDAPSLCKLCEERDELAVTDREFSGSLFHALNESEATVNLLIGSKKFTEGWNSWRVSTMGLMNIGRSEGSEIIQLFGRGVRLKGHNFCLKRSKHVPEVTAPKHVELLETLEVFGIRADYMRQFKEYLEDEGLPANENRIDFVLPVIKNLGTKKLKVPRVKPGVDFKKDGPKPMLDLPPDYLRRNPVVVNWYPKIQSETSKGVNTSQEIVKPDEGKLTDRHVAFMDLDAIYFELTRFKNERAWYNLDLSRERIEDLLATTNWYRLYIPAAELEFTRFSKVHQWQEIAVALLEKYCDRYYKFRKDEYEQPYLEYAEITEDDPNFFEEYRMSIQMSEEALIQKLQELKQLIETGAIRDMEFGNFHALAFGQHLYEPLICFTGETVKVRPVQLNEGEREFVLDLREFYQANSDFFRQRELYLLRNQSRGRGIGFFEAGNFYPDFILWLLANDRQHVTFIDPKGIRNLQGPNDPKIRFYATIKELQTRLGDPAVILNSYIVSNTSFDEIHWWDRALTKDDLERQHVLFQKDDKDKYIGKMLQGLLA